MNQDQVKEKLLQLDKDIPDFKVTFSGKTSKRVDGLYYPDRKEIIIHNKNHATDNELMYTAIHEFAHHIQFSKTIKPIKGKSHSTHFWHIFHTLLYQAEELKIYQNICKQNDEIKEHSRQIKETKKAIAELQKKLGTQLLEARKACIKNNTSFDDFIDREVNLPRSSAKTTIKTHIMDINPEIGYDNMKTVATIKNPETRKKAEQAFIKGNSPEMVKMQYKSPPPKPAEVEKPEEQLQKEKQKIKNQIYQLQKKLDDIDKTLETLAQNEELEDLEENNDRRNEIVARQRE